MILRGVFTRRHYKPKNAKVNSDVTITLILKGGLRIYNNMTMSKSYHLKIFIRNPTNKYQRSYLITLINKNLQLCLYPEA